MLSVGMKTLREVPELLPMYVCAGLEVFANQTKSLLENLLLYQSENCTT
jgi:hypothetical protein